MHLNPLSQDAAMQHRYALAPRCHLVLERGDLTRANVDAIVNAANPVMLGGGGVDGAIHRAAGPKLLAACRQVPKRDGVRCPWGEARITQGFDLPAKWVIHTVGPIFRRTPEPEQVLASAYRNSLALADAQQCRSIAFPAISCGAFGYPLDQAARIAVDTCAENTGQLREIRFVLFGAQTHGAWIKASNHLTPVALPG
jgi:O-acetyl-ADP-ribose deacetylase (regulator of RNase III)